MAKYLKDLIKYLKGTFKYLKSIYHVPKYLKGLNQALAVAWPLMSAQSLQLASQASSSTLGFDRCLHAWMARAGVTAGAAGEHRVEVDCDSDPLGPGVSLSSGSL